jgi:hypothetical protein
MKSFIRFMVLAASLLVILDAGAEPRRVLPLDHGPRAQSTPWVNAQIRAREARQLRQAQGAQAAPGTPGTPESAAEAAPVAPQRG